MMADDDGAVAHDNATSAHGTATVVDQSKAQFHCHKDAVYAVACHYDNSARSLSIASGGGDDRAFLHFVASGSLPAITRTIPLSHPHTDSISCLAFNTPYIHSDVSGKPQRNLLAVGSYDGAIVLYDAHDGSLVQALEGPSDVEWCCFHPKGGTVRRSLILFLASIPICCFDFIRCMIISFFLCRAVFVSKLT